MSGKTCKLLQRGLVVALTAAAMCQQLSIEASSYSEDLSFGCCWEDDYLGFGYNPPAYNLSCGWFVEADYLCLTAHEDNLAYAMVLSNQRPVPVSQVAVGKEIPQKWDSGFRLGAGYFLPCDKWALKAEWTYFNIRPHAALDLVNKGGTAGDVAILPVYGTGGNFIGESGEYTNLAKWELQLNQIDLKIERSFLIGCGVTLKPFIGARAIQLNQKLSSFLTFIGKGNGIGSASAATNQNVLHNDFRGAGAVAGLDSIWDVGCGFGFWGSFDASLVYGRFKTTNELDSVVYNGSVIPNPQIVIEDIRHNFNALRAILDFGIGVQWRTNFNCGRGTVAVKVGWEEHLFFSQNNLPIFSGVGKRRAGVLTSSNFPVPTSQTGDLSLSGLVVKFEIGF